MIDLLWTTKISDVAILISREGSDSTIRACESQRSSIGLGLTEAFVQRINESTLFQVDTKLDQGFTPKFDCIVETNKNHHVLLTGVTGFIGRSILQSLLSMNDSTKITCLIRAQDDSDALKRLQTLCKTLSVNNYEARVSAICGDLTKFNPPLALSSRTLTNLRESITTVVHCGAQVNHSLSFAQLEASNVTSIRHLVMLLSTGTSSLRHFVHVSSISVDNLSEKTSTGEVSLALPKLSNHVIHSTNGYALSKWAAERLLENIQKATRDYYHGKSNSFLNISIVRCGMTSWDSRSGIGNLRDWFCKWCRLVDLTKQYPVAKDVIESGEDEHRWLDLIPVDYTADVIAELCENGTMSDSISLLRLTNPYFLDVNQMVFRRLGAEAVSFDTWQATLKDLVNKTNVDNPISRLAMTAASLFPNYDSLPGTTELLIRGGAMMAPGYEEDNRLHLESSVDRFVEWIVQTNASVGRGKG